MRVRDVFLLPGACAAAALGTWFGAPASYVAVRNWSPVEVSCAELDDNPPPREWVILTDCAADAEHVSVETVRGEHPGHDTFGGHVDGGTYSFTAGVFIPMHSTRHGRASVVLFSDFADTDALAAGTMAAGARAALAKRLAAPVEGLVELQIERSARDRALLDSLPVRDPYWIVDRGARPAPLWRALGELSLGLAGLGYLALRVRRRRQRAASGLARARVVS